MKFLPIIATIALPLAAFAQKKKKEELAARTDEQILQTVKLPDGYDATVFAKPPELGYPTAVSAAMDGTLFIAVDENGSLGRDRNEPGHPRGRIMRVRDTKGTGKADEFKVFAEVESPRGVIWDGGPGNGPGTLYVMHPPNLTAYTDSTGSGKANKQEDILTGLGFDLNFRGADHTTNGCRLGIDGFIYIAMGDYGCVEAKAKDGTTLKHRGGGVVRIRPDGTGLELVVQGTRNIYDVSVSPTLDVFTRDNTNDGGDWNDRVSFHPVGAHMGYPMLFKNFPEDMIETMADFGGGSPCGSMWLDEPGLPAGLFTVEWGAGGIFYHDDLVQNGAGWKLANAPAGNGTAAYKRPPVPQKKWLALTRPTDIDVDASGRLYITSWEGATFNYAGPNAGYVLRVVKKDLKPQKQYDLKAMSPAALAALVASPSAVLRLEGQREILRRKAEQSVRDLVGYATTATTPGGRVACIQTLRQLAGARAIPALLALLKNDDTREQAIIALGDDSRLATQVPDAPLISVLADKNPRVRSAAITALRRLHKTAAAPALLPLVADSDPIISHIAVRGLSEFKAADVCLGALDSADAKVQPGALRALYGMYEPAAVDGLIRRLPNAKGELREGILNALCRLDNQDAPYTDPKVWWGTRPDTSGPVYQPIRWSESDKIEATLKKAIDAASGEEGRKLVQRLYLTKVNLPGLVELMLSKAGNDIPAKLTAVEGMIRPDHSMPAEATAALKSIALDDKGAPELRARALRVLQRCAENGGVFPVAVAAFAPLAGHDLPHPALTAAFEDFTRDAKNGKWVNDYNRALHDKDPAKRQLAATVLVNLGAGRVGKEKDRESAKTAVEKSFDHPETAAALLGAIARSGAKPFGDLVKANLNNPNNAVAEAALFAFQKLGLGGAGTGAKTIGAMKYEDVVAAVKTGGDAKAGSEMFLKAGCIACHTIDANEPPKGPVLSAVAKVYDRAALTESILKPSAKIAQGFETQWIKTKKGEQIEGFVVREGADSVDLRNVVGQTVTIEKGDITERGKRDTSIMPEGLLNTFAPADLANLLAWLESLKK